MRGEGSRRPDHDRASGADRPSKASETRRNGARYPKKSDGLLRQGECGRYAFIDAEKATRPVEAQCGVLDVSRSGLPGHHHGVQPAARTLVERLQRENVTMECMHCKGEMRRSSAPFSVDGNGYHVPWDAVPAWVCEQCGEPYFESPEVARIQRALAALDRETGAA